MSSEKALQIGRYQIKSKLGDGAMAIVLRAHDPVFKRDVAIKVLHRQYSRNEVIRKRFLREARALAQLDHPAIVPIYDFGQERQRVYLVMRLMHEDSLADRIQAEGKRSFEEIALVMHRIGDALDKAHEEGFIHRDVKPDNILFDQYDQPFLGDFGIVSNTGSHGTLTTDRFIGSPAYMSPEQVDSNRTVDGRSDLYALGIVLFEMLTGELPYQADTAMRLAMQHLTADVPKVYERNQQLPKQWQKLIDRAMAKEPDERFQSGEALSVATKALIERSKPNEVAPVTDETEQDKRSSLRLWLIAAGVLGPLLVLWLIFTQVQANSAEAQRQAQLSLDATATSIAQLNQAAAIALEETAIAVDLAENNPEALIQTQTSEAESGLATFIAQDEATNEARLSLTEAALAADSAEIATATSTSTPVPTATPQPLLSCSQADDYNLAIADEAALSHPVGYSSASSTGEEFFVQWEVENLSETCAFSLQSVRLLDGNQLVRSDLTRLDGQLIDELAEGETGAIVIYFDDNLPTEVDGTWVIAASGGEDRPIPLDDYVLTLQLDQWIVEIENVTPTVTLRAVATPRPNTAATSTRAAANANFNATETARAQQAQAQATQTQEARVRAFQMTQTAQAAAANNNANATASAQAVAFRATETARANSANQRATQTAQANAAAWQATQTAQAATPTPRPATPTPPTPTSAPAPTQTPSPFSCDVSNPDGDSDGDGKLNKFEIAEGLDPCDPDTDDDGFIDGQDVCPLSAGEPNGNGCPGTGTDR